MRKTLLMLLAFMLSICGWSVNYTVTISSSDNDAGYVDINIPKGDVDGETDYCTSDYGGDVTFEVKEGRKVVLTASSNDDELYYFVNWSDGVTTNPRTISKVQSDLDLTANFAEYPSYTITAVADPAIAVDYIDAWAINEVDGEAGWCDVKEGETVYLEFGEIQPGYRFLGWYDGSNLISSNNSCTVVVGNTNKTYTAKFEEIPVYKVTVIADVPEGGYVGVWSSNTIDEDGESLDGENDWKYWITVQEGESVNIWAEVKAGYRFLGWYIGTDFYSNNLTPTSFVPEEDMTLTAKFEEIPLYTISVSTQPAGLFEEDSYNVYVYNTTNYEDSETSLQIPEGSQFGLNASPQGLGLSEHLGFDHWESDKGGYNTNTGFTAYPYEDEHWTAVYTPNFGDYQQVGTTNLYSKDNGGPVDIKGIDNNKYYRSTYSDGGYQAAIKVGDNSAMGVYNGMDVDGVKVNTSVLQSGGMARVIYTVFNSSDEAQTISLGTYADVMIGENDAAPIQAIKDDNDKTIGIVMRDGQGGQLYVIFGLGVAGVSLIDDYWFGFYGSNNSYDAIVGDYSTDIANYMEENGNYDSGMGWCWKNRTLEAGQTIMYSFMVGIGEVKMEPTATVTLTPLDVDSWNNLSIAHPMYAEGIYTHTSGLDGYLEYQVETTDDDKWTTLVTDPERLPSDGYYHGTFNATFDPSKSIHTIHFRTRDVLGNITVLPSCQYEDMKDYELSGEIVDKTYNGQAQTQDVFVPGIQAGKYTVSYSNNINAGTANVILAGNFPHTIGYKEYSFTINPKPLAGEIVFLSDNIVYNGDEQTPGWTLPGYTITENKDYTATWSNNILPGKGKLTVKGKGNYSGTLTANFTILKITILPSMYTVKLPANALYDGEQHLATVQTISGVGTTTLKYYVNNVEQAPVEGGTYNVRLSIAESDFYYGISDVAVGSFKIWRMDPEEWAALQAIYAELSTRTWERPWDMSKGEAGAGKFDGLTFTEGHVTELDLSENSLDGNFPLSTLTLPYMTSLNLSHNSLSGNVENGLGATEIAAIAMKSQLVNLHIANNELEGNIGIFAQALPNLVSLDASTNHIENVYPMLSTKITGLNLNNQIILTPRVIDLPSVAGDYEALLTLVPTVMLYNHAAQSYLPVSSTVVTIKDNLTNPKFEAGVVITDFVNHEWTFACTENKNVFNFTTDDLLYVTNQNTTSRFSAKLNFNDGDADFSGATDVLDLQASINFIFNEFSAVRPFNFTAANLFKDAMINVQDIVLMTELLLADTDSDPLAAPARVKEAAQDAEAELRWENGELHLTSQKDVAALDLIVDADAAIEWLVPTHELVTKQTLNGQHAVIYSFEGNTFAANNDIVIARSKDLMPVTTKAVLADKEAQPISVRRITVDAKVPTGIDSQESVIENRKLLINGVLYIERDGKMYDATGRLVRTQLQ